MIAPPTFPMTFEMLSLIHVIGIPIMDLAPLPIIEPNAPAPFTPPATLLFRSLNGFSMGLRIEAISTPPPLPVAPAVGPPNFVLFAQWTWL